MIFNISMRDSGKTENQMERVKANGTMKQNRKLSQPILDNISKEQRMDLGNIGRIMWCSKENGREIIA